MQNAAFAATLRVIHRNKYWRPLVSSYDDPRWYEQPKADEWYRSTPDEQFNLPSAVNSNTSKPQQAYPEDPQLDGGRRLGQIFGQIVVTVTLTTICPNFWPSLRPPSSWGSSGYACCGLEVFEFTAEGKLNCSSGVDLYHSSALGCSYQRGSS